MIKQEINLYLPEFKKIEPLFSAVTIMQLMVFVAIALMLTYSYGIFKNRSMNQELQYLQLQAQGVQVTLDKLRMVAIQEPDLRLTEEANKLERLIESNEVILRVLAKSGLLESQGFATKLEGLGNKNIDGMWLTTIRFEDGGKSVSLEGWTYKAEMVPQYLQRVSKGKEFKSASFGTLTMEHDLNKDNGAYKFKIGTSTLIDNSSASIVSERSKVTSR